MIRVPYQVVVDTLASILIKLGVEQERALLCSQLFADTTCDGVYSHGLNRFPRFLQMIENGSVDIHATPERVLQRGSLERWDGKRGIGNLNAHQSMQQALALAKQHGMGCVALANTNHWMRGGSYGWQAANAGMIGICWTNTLANLPPWGASAARIGNNPLVFAVPRPDGHVVLDIAMSQFSYGALASYAERGELLPVDGGFDSEGKLTRDPSAIEISQRALPIGYWKGSGLSMMLDMIATLLSGGLATHQLSRDPLREVSLSQVFLAFDLSIFGHAHELASAADGIIQSLHGSEEDDSKDHVRYPGERTVKLRAENMALGLPIEPELWNQLRTM